VTLEADRDGLDPEATQIVALDGGRVVGTCRLVLDEGLARLGRMAVDDDWRGRGVGGALLREAEAQARALGATRIRLHAQLAAHSLYERGGFEVKGEQFMEEGIPHLTMEKLLA
jgi:predicted GNAT family N-acyltransferase